MPIVFLVPAILAGLAALTIPVLLHLRRRERERPMRSTSTEANMQIAPAASQAPKIPGMLGT